MEFTEVKLGRIFILRLHNDERLHEILESFATEKKISAALVLFLGGAKSNSKVVVGPEKGESIPPIPMITMLKGVHESHGIGTIFLDETGIPKLHMHASFGRNQNTITGCVRLGVDVWRIGEAIILELTGTTINRVKDEETGFEFLEIE
jgi:predicted DNA-binding protein with PD1-like motif